MSPASSFRSHPVPGQSAPPRPPVSQCVISFGSNLGDRRELICAAARAVATSGLPIDGQLKTSRLFETPPIGGPDGQEPFLNAVGVFETSAPARTVLDFLQGLENDLGRIRKRRWDARSIDLDVVLHGKLVGGATGLVVPHPRYTARQFVLQPACDVASHFRDPRFGWTLGRLAKHLMSAPPSLALVSGSQELRQQICDRLRDEHGIRVRKPGDTTQSLGRVSDGPWVAADAPELPIISDTPGYEGRDAQDSGAYPRLIVRIQPSPTNQNPSSQWPAPHLMWPSGWRWPEYRLEISDVDWAVGELASALDSMQCTVHPATNGGDWW